MTAWNIYRTQNFDRDFKVYEKKHPYELVAVLRNLDTYFSALKKLGHPMQIKASFIHNEPDGIKALDQRGGKQKVKLQQTRLYIYPSVKGSRLYLLAIGDKRSQRRDIQNCRQILRHLRSG